jgi:hypothetical protein
MSPSWRKFSNRSRNVDKIKCVCPGEVADLVKQYGLPALRRAGTISGLIGFFETGPGIIYAGSRRQEVLSALKQLVGDGGCDV